jgi:Glycosyl hydrolase family 99
MRLRRLLVAAGLVLGVVAALPAPALSAERDPVPVLAHYYIWFQPTSWNRAKKDFPRLGRYSSDERDIMLQHIRWAKQVGIDGFIVSWKDTPDLTSRLAKLVAIARSENFKLAIVYQGLDFERDPLPIDQIKRDLTSFLDVFGGNPVFELFGDEPVVTLSGSWEFSREEIAELSPLRPRLNLLASERDVEGYERVADLVDGDLYYWSSVNPNTFPGYGGKLREMSKAIHARGGLWIAPAAPGFDARLLGKTTVVDRRDGETLRRELDAAFRSGPDAVGIISWNEFSENTHIEPSGRYQGRYLHVLADYLGADPPTIENFDSDAPAATDLGYGVPLLFALTLLAAAGIFLASARRRRDGGPGVASGRLPPRGGGGDQAGSPSSESNGSGDGGTRKPLRDPVKPGS